MLWEAPPQIDEIGPVELPTTVQLYAVQEWIPPPSPPTPPSLAELPTTMQL